MNRIVAGTLLALSIATPALADKALSTGYETSRALPSKTVAEEIDDAVWSLKFSSVAKSLDRVVVDNSLAMLEKARAELAVGHVRTANELLRRASQPLTRMSDSAMQGRHPDQRRLMGEMRETLLSIITAADRIAAERNASADFVGAARLALSRSDALAAEGKMEAAHELLQRAYTDLSQEVAELRAGELFYIATPSGASDAEWQDGLRRIDERRAITRYIEAEAKWEGLDTRPLEQGYRAAEKLVDRATALANEKRWAQALAYLDNAYAAYEQSWRAVGVEW